MTRRAPSEVEGRALAWLTPRERAAWAAGFVLVVAVLVFTRFTSRDPDSALYASISERLSTLPVTHWIAPQWWALWPGTGLDQLFREHPAGIFLIPAALDRLGIPGVQAAYVVGIAAGLAALLLIGGIVSRLCTRDDARAVVVLLQFMPAAFIFRIRSNHEYPMLVCLLLCLAGLEGLRRSRWHAALVVAGLVGGVLIKGVFVVPILIAAVLWIAIDPPASGSRGRQIAALATGGVAIVAVIVMYDALYRHVTGESFWRPYWDRQMAPVTMTTPTGDASGLVRQFGFYALRLLWHPAPWSLALIWAAARGMRKRAGTLTTAERRGITFALTFAAVLVAMFSVPSRFAERYVFSGTYAVGTCGAIVAWRASPGLRAAFGRLDGAVPALPALVWTVLMLARLALGPWIPRIQDH